MAKIKGLGKKLVNMRSAEESKIIINQGLPEHNQFLLEKREDPFTFQIFKHQDEVIVTENREVWLLHSWVASGESTNKYLDELPLLKKPEFSPAIHKFSFSPDVIAKGEPFSLHWTTTYSDKVHISDIGYFEEKTGQVDLIAKETKRYLLTAVNKKGSKKEILLVRIVSPILYVSRSKIEFGRFFTNQIPDPILIHVRNTGPGSLEWQVSDVPNWVTVEKSSSEYLEVSVNTVTSGLFSGRITIHSNGGEAIIPVSAHIMPVMIQSFNVSRVGYHAKVTWEATASSQVLINGKQVTTKGEKLVPYLHKSEIKMSVRDEKGNSDSRTYTINVPIPDLLKPGHLLENGFLINHLKLDQQSIHLILNQSLYHISQALSTVKTKLTDLLTLNTSVSQLSNHQQLASTNITLNKKELTHHNPLPLNTITIKLTDQ